MFEIGIKTIILNNHSSILVYRFKEAKIMFIKGLLESLRKHTAVPFCKKVPEVHREPPKMLSRWNPPKYQFHHHKCMDHGLNALLDQILHPTPRITEKT